MKPSTVLKKARAFLAGRGHWMQGRQKLFRVDGTLKSACALGACWDIDPAGTFTSAPNYLIAALPPEVEQYVSSFNDDPKRKKKDIIALFDRAITLARKAGA